MSFPHIYVFHCSLNTLFEVPDIGHILHILICYEFVLLRLLGKMSRIHIGGNLPTPKIAYHSPGKWKATYLEDLGTEKQRF